MASQPEDVQLQEIVHCPRLSGGADAVMSGALPPARQPTRHSASQIYSSAPLGDSPTAIRVLEVAEQHDAGNTVIRCDLCVVDLTDRPNFTALSYVWGDPTIQETIWCSNEPVKVTRNAWNALRRLRNRFAPLTIWIDAICINQTDEAEKTRQIQLMGKIYSSAVFVYIWLGEGNEKTDRAMRYLACGALPFKRVVTQTVADLSTDRRDDFNPASAIPTGIRMTYRLIMHAANKTIFLRQKRMRFDLQELLSRPWIGRVWTLQEVLLAQRPVIVCGDASVSWFAFLCAVEVFELFRNGGGGVFKVVLPWETAPWLQLAAIWKSWREPKPTGPLAPSSRDEQLPFTERIDLRERSIEPAASIDASNRDGAADAPSNQPPIDFDMALIELHARQIRQLYGSIAAQLLPWGTYTFLLVFPHILVLIPLSLVHRGWWVWPMVSLLVIALGLFFALAFIHLGGFGPTPPTTKRQRRPLPWKLALVQQIAQRQCTAPEDQYYGVLGIIGSHFHRLDDDRERFLAVSGQQHAYTFLCLDLITWTFSLDFLLFQSSTKRPGSPTWITQWHQASRSWVDYLHNPEILRLNYDKMEKHVTRGATPGSVPRHRWEARCSGQLIVRAILLTTIDWVSQTDRHMDKDEKRLSIRQQIVADTMAHPLTKTFGVTNTGKRSRIGFALMKMGQMINLSVLDDRVMIRWFRSEDKLFGMAHKDAQVGDSLVLISGLSMPMILRPDPWIRYSVVGPVYMPGLLDGEEWTAAAQERLEEIVLI